MQPQTALFNALGIASGNAATMVPLLMMCFLPLVYVYLQVSFSPVYFCISV